MSEDFAVGDLVSYEDYDGVRSGSVTKVFPEHVMVKIDLRMFYQKVRKSRCRKLRPEELTAYWKKVTLERKKQ